MRRLSRDGVRVGGGFLLGFGVLVAVGGGALASYTGWAALNLDDSTSGFGALALGFAIFGLVVGVAGVIGGIAMLVAGIGMLATGDGPQVEHRVSLAPYLVPTSDGAMAGVGGTF